MVVYLTCFSLILILKGTVSVISSEPPCKDDIARFITLPLKALSYQIWIIHHLCFFFFFCLFSFTVSQRKWLEHFLVISSSLENHKNKHLWVRKTTVSPTFFYKLDKSFKGTFVNRTLTSLHRGLGSPKPSTTTPSIPYL